MGSMWEEVAAVKAGGRRELVLHGQKISDRINKNGLDPNIYKLDSLNYLEIANTSLTTLKPEIGNLVNLTTLVLCNNKISNVPVEIGKLTKLKLLNLSNNQIESMPDVFKSLPELDTLNLSMNKLGSLPSMNDLKALHVFSVAYNKLDAVPEGLFDGGLIHLSQVHINDNAIQEIPAEVEDLAHLNVLDASNNRLASVPPELCRCPKLKELNLKGNKMSDKRFLKLTEKGATGTKGVMNYLEAELKKSGKGAAKGGKGGDKKGKKKKGQRGEEEEIEELAKNVFNVLRMPSESSAVVTVTPALVSVRPYIVCCIVRNVDLQSSSSTFKNFISLQTKLHDTVCEKRQVATIATHDLRLVRLPLKFDARFPQLLQILPLGKKKEVSGEKLFEDLRKQAEDLRKEKKRSTVSGIHKYLELLEDKTQYPCLVDRDDAVISFPPITNSDKTKISAQTTDLFIEVTSSTNLDTCKKVMDTVLLRMLELGLGSKSVGNHGNKVGDSSSSSDSEEEDGIVFEKKNVERLSVEQVKVIDNDGGLKVLYPSRTDLAFDMVDIKWN